MVRKLFGHFRRKTKRRAINENKMVFYGNETETTYSKTKTTKKTGEHILTEMKTK